LNEISKRGGKREMKNQETVKEQLPVQGAREHTGYGGKKKKQKKTILREAGTSSTPTKEERL